MATDPKKKKKAKSDKVSITVSKKNSALTDTQQLSDVLAKKVASGKLTNEQAQKIQRAADKKAMSVKSIQNTTGKGTPKIGGSSHGKKRKPKFKRDNRGNIKAY